MFRTMIITYHAGIDSKKLIDEARKTLTKRHFNKCPSPGWVCHAIIDSIIDSLLPIIRQTTEEVAVLEDMTFKVGLHDYNEFLKRIQKERSKISLFRYGLWPKSTITHNFLRTEWRIFVNEVSEPFWRDINDHVSRMVDSLNLSYQTLESLQNIFVGKLSLEMAKASNDLSSIGGKVSGIGAVFLPLTFLTGLWGMNCKVPFQYNGDNPNDSFIKQYGGFIFILIIMFITSLTSYLIVKKKGWLDDSDTKITQNLYDNKLNLNNDIYGGSFNPMKKKLKNKYRLTTKDVGDYSRSNIHSINIKSTNDTDTNIVIPTNNSALTPMGVVDKMLTDDDHLMRVRTNSTFN